MIRILVVDPHPIVHTAFEKIAKDHANMQLLPAAYLHNHALKTLSHDSNVDIIIMEVEQLGISPVTLIQKFQAEYPKIKIIVFSNQPTKVYAVSLLKAGATAYLTKRTDSHLVLEALLYVYEKGFYVISKNRNQLDYHVDPYTPTTEFENLSPREIEVLKLLVQGIKNIEIAKQLSINQKTVNTYKTRILEKLNVDNTFDLYIHTKYLRIL